MKFVRRLIYPVHLSWLSLQAWETGQLTISDFNRSEYFVILGRHLFLVCIDPQVPCTAAVCRPPKSMRPAFLAIFLVFFLAIWPHVKSFCPFLYIDSKLPSSTNGNVHWVFKYFFSLIHSTITIILISLDQMWEFNWRSLLQFTIEK